MGKGIGMGIGMGMGIVMGMGMGMGICSLISRWIISYKYTLRCITV
jgi:hypothetical protein